jgi:hypothetical protein
VYSPYWRQRKPLRLNRWSHDLNKVAILRRREVEQPYGVDEVIVAGQWSSAGQTMTELKPDLHLKFVLTLIRAPPSDPRARFSGSAQAAGHADLELHLFSRPRRDKFFTTTTTLRQSKTGLCCPMLCGVFRRPSFYLNNPLRTWLRQLRQPSIRRRFQSL